LKKCTVNYLHSSVSPKACTITFKRADDIIGISSDPK
jgi:hypothetical protein